MSKYLTEKQVFKRLEAAFGERFTEKELDRAEFLTDLEGDFEHVWRFSIDGQDHSLTCDRISGSVTYANYY